MFSLSFLEEDFNYDAKQPLLLLLLFQRKCKRIDGIEHGLNRKKKNATIISDISYKLC